MLALRGMHRRPRIALRLTDVEGKGRALVEEPEELPVDLIDSGPPFRQTHTRSRERSYKSPPSIVKRVTGRKLG